MKINYLEIPVRDLAATKTFYGAAFGWTFTDYGPAYSSFEGAGLDGGFRLATDIPAPGVMVVLKHNPLEEARERVTGAGATLTKDIFSFPGGRRFEFSDPSGNVLAVWGD